MLRARTEPCVVLKIRRSDTSTKLILRVYGSTRTSLEGHPLERMNCCFVTHLAGRGSISICGALAERSKRVKTGRDGNGSFRRRDGTGGQGQYMTAGEDGKGIC